MAIRMTGLISGMDTEAVVGALMSAQSLKKTKVENQKTKLEWKQTKWADLNTKLVSFYNNYVTKMRLSSSFKTKKASVSDETKASVTANSSAVNGNYTMEVKGIASAQFLTSGKLDASSGSAKLTEIDASLLNKEIAVEVGGKKSTFLVEEDSTLNSFTTFLKNAGLNASFDTNQKRLFISSKDSGLKNAFSITSTSLSEQEMQVSKDLREQAGYSYMSADNKKIVDAAMKQLQTFGVGTEEFEKALEDISSAAVEGRKAQAGKAAEAYVKAEYYSKFQKENGDEYEARADEELGDKYLDTNGLLKDEGLREEYEKAKEEKIGQYISQAVENAMKSDDAKERVLKITARGEAEINKSDLNESAYGSSRYIALTDEAKAKYFGDESFVVSASEGYTEEGMREDLRSYVTAYANVPVRSDALGTSALASLGLADITVDEDGQAEVAGGAENAPEGMAFVAASDSRILLNGAELSSASSTVSVNGLDISLKGVTAAGEKITFSVGADVDAVYDSVKKFIGEYNTIMKEMYDLYNAESASNYDPLTKEQKEEMTDDDIKLWEDKIKNASLRRDSKLSGIMQSMRDAMMSTVSYNGKKYALSSYGIMTSTNYLEGGMLHIYGDSEDNVYADKEDKLKAAIQNDSDAVVTVLTGVFEKLRSTMYDKMKATTTSSTMTFYDDKTISDSLKQYDKDITAWEDKLASMEESYYKKFTAMETAMAKMQTQQNSLSGFFGS